MDLRKNLQLYREKAGYKTAKDFSIALGIPYNTYTAYENQKREPKLDTLIKIANLLNVSLDDLLGRSQNNEDEQLKQTIEKLFIGRQQHSFDTNIPPAIFVKEITKNAIVIDTQNFRMRLSKKAVVKFLNDLNTKLDEQKKDEFKHLLDILVSANNKIFTEQTLGVRGIADKKDYDFIREYDFVFEVFNK